LKKIYEISELNDDEDVANRKSKLLEGIAKKKIQGRRIRKN